MATLCHLHFYQPPAIIWGKIDSNKDFFSLYFCIMILHGSRQFFYECANVTSMLADLCGKISAENYLLLQKL